MKRGTLEWDIENASVALLKELGWSHLNVQEETYGPGGTLGREHRGEVVLRGRLGSALRRLNPKVPDEAIRLAVEELTRDRSALTLVQANREVHKLLRDGVPVRIPGSDDEAEHDLKVRVMDWDCPEKNELFLAQQLWVQGEIYLRRADLIGFVNGLPLVFIELKGVHKNVERAYRENFHDYLSAVPQLFWYNAFAILSSGIESRIGTLTGAWEHFKQWKRIEREDEPPRSELEVSLRGLCERRRLLDLVENFILFSDQKSSTAKLVGQNHQFLGVNNAIEAVKTYQLALRRPSAEQLKERRRLGVFWHTQGSGKSFSMVFFSQKILRKLPGNWTFVILTDREDLDGQIYKTFAGCGAVTEDEKTIRAQSAKHLKALLQEDHRYVFTLIQKFRTDEKGGLYPKLSDRSDIIVIADEAHRTQYDSFATNMRRALPNAAFIGFTGTPLMMTGEEKTREVFGDYVSVYNFRQAIEDQATVPLYYEARIPELQLTNEDFSDDLVELLDQEDLDEEQRKKVEQSFAQQYHLITRKERLGRIAADLVDHFLGLASGTKAMVVSIDKLTAVKMYNYVRAAWDARLSTLRQQLDRKPPADREDRQRLEAQIAYMAQTDMAVVVSSAQNEIEDFKKKKLDILPHRLRMNKEDLDTKFKDGGDPLRIVFVCAMWMTGFDVPSCGAIYLDKPMRNHTLMQTIARANRVYEDKEGGLIVDYIGVFRNLQKALAIYGSGSGGGVRKGDTPVQSKDVLLGQLAAAVETTKRYCSGHEVDIDQMAGLSGFARLARLKPAVDRLIHPDDVKKTFLLFAGQVDRLFRAVGLDPRKDALAPAWGVLQDLARSIRALQAPVDISHVMDAVEALLDSSIGARELRPGYGKRVHLGQIDFATLSQQFAATENPATFVEILRTTVQRHVDGMVRMNPSRGALREKLEQLIAEYNSGSTSVDEMFKRFVEFMEGDVREEELRATRSGLSEEQLAFYDTVRAAGGKLAQKDQEVVLRIARDLPGQIAPRLTIDWRKNQLKRAAVRKAIERALDDLPRSYSDEAFQKLVDVLFEHVYESYFGEGKSKYSTPDPD